MGELLNNLWTNTIENLTAIWVEIGYNKEERSAKARRVYASIKSKLKELEEEDENYKKALIEKLDNLGAEVCHITKCLQEDPNKITEPDVEMSLLELEEYLKHKLHILNKEVSRRKSIFSQLKNQELELCNELSEDPSDDGGKQVPSEEDIKYKNQIIETLKMQKVKRKKTYSHLRSSIMSHMSDLQREPFTLFEKKVFSEIEDQVALSITNLQNMKRISDKLGIEVDEKRKETKMLTEEIELLSNRLEITAQERNKFKLSLSGRLKDDFILLTKEKMRLQEIRQQHMGKFVAKLREELIMWWDKCYMSEDERESFEPMYESNYTEEILELHESELERMKAVYKRDSCIYKKVSVWFDMWEKVTELEEKANDPKRLFGNRGCSLLQEEKERKRVDKLLPKTESELETLIKTVEEERCEPFLVCGLEFSDFIKAQRQTYNNKKQKEKKERQEAKTKQMQLDAKIGTSKVSVKRRNTTRNINSTSKYIKTGDNQRAPVVRDSTMVLSRFSSMNSIYSQYKPSSKLQTLRENIRKLNDNVENVLSSTEVSTYVKFSERLHTMSERENIRSSILIPNRLRRMSPRLTPKGLPRTPSRTPLKGSSMPLRRNAYTVPSNYGQRRSTRLNTLKSSVYRSPSKNRIINSPSMRTTPLKNKLNFLI